MKKKTLLIGVLMITTTLASCGANNKTFLDNKNNESDKVSLDNKNNKSDKVSLDNNDTNNDKEILKTELKEITEEFNKEVTNHEVLVDEMTDDTNINIGYDTLYAKEFTLGATLHIENYEEFKSDDIIKEWENIKYTPGIVMIYTPEHWLFSKEYSVKTDNNKYQINSSEMQWETNMDNGFLTETGYQITSSQKDIEMIRDMGQSNQTLIRLSGHKKYADFILDQEDKDKLNELVKLIDKINKSKELTKKIKTK